MKNKENEIIDYMSVSGNDIEISEMEIVEEQIMSEDAVMMMTDDTATAETVTTSIVTIDLSDISQWRSGMYSSVNGAYQEYSSRICTTDYLSAVPNTEYKIKFSEQSLYMTIYEISENNELLNVKTLGSGSIITTNENTVKVGITLRGGNYSSYEEYQNLFETSGFYVGLEYESTEQSGETETPSDSGQTSQTVTGVSAEDLKIAFGEALDEYFSNETVRVIQVDAGLNKKLDELCFSDVCLAILVMFVISQGILKIIGGRSWNK